MLNNLLTRKDVASLRARAKAEDGFRRTLGVCELSAIGIGFVVGSGIFVLTGHIAAENAGPAVVLAFLLAAIPAALVSMCYAEMASTVPGGGGAYLYTAASLGSMPAFLVGWTLTFTYCIGAATVAGGWSSYAVDALREFGIVLPRAITQAPSNGGVADVPAALIVLLLSAFLLLGASTSMRLTMAIVALKVAVVLAFVIGVGSHVDAKLWHPFIPEAMGWHGVWTGAGLAMFAYLGVDNIATAVQETKQPEKAVPVAIAITMGVAVALYCGVCLVLTGALPYAHLGVDDPLAFAARILDNRVFVSIVQYGALLGLTSVLLIQIYGLPRILYAMAEDGLAPPWAHRLGKRRAAPGASTLIMGAVCSIAAAFTPVQSLAEVTATGTLATFTCVSIGVAVLRHEHPSMKRSFHVPGGAFIVPGAAALSSMALFFTAPWLSLAVLGIWWLVGAGVYLAVKGAKSGD